jgi:hypothetical protein
MAMNAPVYGITGAILFNSNTFSSFMMSIFVYFPTARFIIFGTLIFFMIKYKRVFPEKLPKIARNKIIDPQQMVGFVEYIINKKNSGSAGKIMLSTKKIAYNATINPIGPNASKKFIIASPIISLG